MFSTESVKGFDFHCHIDLFPDPPAIIEKCEENSTGVLSVTTTPKAWPKNLDWMSESRFTYAAVGLHPELVADRYGEIDLLEEYISESRLVGETNT